MMAVKISCNSNSVTLELSLDEADTFLPDLSNALTEALTLAFERRELDLGEEQCFAFYTLMRFSQTLREAERRVARLQNRRASRSKIMVQAR